MRSPPYPHVAVYAAVAPDKTNTSLSLERRGNLYGLTLVRAKDGRLARARDMAEAIVPEHGLYFIGIGRACNNAVLKQTI